MTIPGAPRSCGSVGLRRTGSARAGTRHVRKRPHPHVAKDLVASEESGSPSEIEQYETADDRRRECFLAAERKAHQKQGGFVSTERHHRSHSHSDGDIRCHKRITTQASAVASNAAAPIASP